MLKNADVKHWEICPSFVISFIFVDKSRWNWILASNRSYSRKVRFRRISREWTSIFLWKEGQVFFAGGGLDCCYLQHQFQICKFSWSKFCFEKLRVWKMHFAVLWPGSVFKEFFFSCISWQVSTISKREQEYFLFFWCIGVLRHFRRNVMFQSVKFSRNKS